MKDKLDSIIFVFKRWVEKEGKGTIGIFISRIILSVGASVYGIVLAGIIVGILERGGDKRAVLLHIISISVLYAGVKVADYYFLAKIHFSTFAYRIVEAPQMLFKLSKLPFYEVEGKAGKQEFEKANEAVGLGNHIGVEALIKNVTMVIINLLCVVIFMVISARLSAVILVVLLITGYLRTIKDKKNRKWIVESKDEMNKNLYDRIYLYRKCLDSKIGKDARIYSMENWFKNKLSINLNKMMFFIKVKSKNNFLAECIQNASGALRDLVCYGYLIYRVSQGMPISEFVLYLGVIAGFNVFIKNIFDEYAKLEENLIVVRNLRSYLDKEEIGTGEHSCEVPESKGYNYVFENVSFSYEDGVEVLSGLNLTIKAGEKIALVGVNGAGKTTLVKLMSGLYKPTKGRILLNGVDISKVSPKELMRITGVVFQETKVFPYSLEKNISCKLDGKIEKEKLDYSLKQAGIYDYVQKLKDKEKTILTKNLEQSGVEMSGGQYQKLMLARALYKDAPILILDEPTAALDPLAEAEMYKKYDELTKEKTSVFISHRLSSTQFCDRVVFLQDGMIKQSGTHEELMKQEGFYKEMFDAQAHYYKEEVASCKC